MGNISLDQLIKITFLDEATKKEALEKLPTLTDDQKNRLEQICWENLQEWFAIKFDEEKEKMITEMALGDDEYKPEDFEIAKDKILTELLTKISEVKTNDELAQVKQELKQKLNQNSTSPSSQN